SKTTGALWLFRSRRIVISETPSRAAASLRCNLSLRFNSCSSCPIRSSRRVSIIPLNSY
ncbi:hypothetical protein EC100833_1248, partial [Escherichia coli 10.0833]